MERVGRLRAGIAPGKESVGRLGIGMMWRFERRRQKHTPNQTAETKEQHLDDVYGDIAGAWTISTDFRGRVSSMLWRMEACSSGWCARWWLKPEYICGMFRIATGGDVALWAELTRL